MNEPKRHHYLPQFYLRNFCNDKLLSVFDKKKNEYRKQNPKDTAVERYYYSLKDDNGNMDHRIEKLFSQIETNSQQIIDRIINNENITEQEKADLSHFIALMMVRVPNLEKLTNTGSNTVINDIANTVFLDKKTAKKAIYKRECVIAVTHAASAEELVKFHKNGNYDIKINRNVVLSCMLQLAQNTWNDFNQMHWDVVHTKDNKSFITTDNPIVIMPPNKDTPRGLCVKGSLIIFPLSQSTCLVMSYGGNNNITHSDVETPFIRGVNLFLSSESDRLIIARDEKLISSLVADLEKYNKYV